MVCCEINACDIALPFRQDVRQTVADLGVLPKLVAFLANEDPAARKYAQWTSKSFQSDGIDFEVRHVPRTELEERVMEANGDAQVHGIMIYYPVFGDQQDQYLQSIVSKTKDVEGLCHEYKFNLYHNIRFLDPPTNARKCLIPCTPLAIVKVLEYLGIYNRLLEEGNRLHGKTITIINRSETVGRPLAALLANDGAFVYSVDIHDVLVFHRGAGIALKRHEVEETSKTLEEVLPMSDVVVSGVPSPDYQVPTHLLKEGVVAVNFSSAKNFGDDIMERASLFVPSVGKVTVAMLERNLLRLYSYQKPKQKQ